MGGGVLMRGEPALASISFNVEYFSSVSIHIACRLLAFVRYLFEFAYISLYLLAFPCICLHFLVFACVSLYLLIFACIFLYLLVFAFIRLYLLYCLYCLRSAAWG